MPKEKQTDWLAVNEWLQNKRNVDKPLPKKLLGNDWQTELWHDLVSISASKNILRQVPFGNTILTNCLIFKLKSHKFNDLPQTILPDKFGSVDIGALINGTKVYDATLDYFHSPCHTEVINLNQYGLMQAEFIDLGNKKYLPQEYFAKLRLYFSGEAKIYTYPYYLIGNGYSTYFRANDGIGFVVIDHPQFTLITNYGNYPEKTTWADTYDVDNLPFYYVIKSEQARIYSPEFYSTFFNLPVVPMKYGVILPIDPDTVDLEHLGSKVREFNRLDANSWSYSKVDKLIIPPMYVDCMRQLFNELSV